MTDFGNPFVEPDKLIGTALHCRPFLGAHGMTRLTSSKNRIERVLREDMLDVRDERLMLLFVMNAEHENWFDFIEQTLVGI